MSRIRGGGGTVGAHNLGRPHSQPRVQGTGPQRYAVVQGYELWASTYDRDPNPLLALEERTLQCLLPSLDGRDALDIGCGTGRWLERLLRAGIRSATGIDLSAAMLAAAQSKRSLSGRLVRADCLFLPLRPITVDLVICSFVVEHIPHLSMLAGELARVTKPGADCYVSDIHPRAYANGWRPGFRCVAGAAEITTSGHSFVRIRDTFAAQGLKLADYVEPRLGGQEMPIFDRAGRIRRFHEAARGPALLICHFTRAASTGSTL